MVTPEERAASVVQGWLENWYGLPAVHYLPDLEARIAHAIRAAVDAEREAIAATAGAHERLKANEIKAE